MTRGGRLTFPYCDDYEKKEIIEMYRSGMYSYAKIGELKNLSKSTVINYVKDYPYNKDSVTLKARYSRLQEDSLSNLKQEIQRSESEAHKAYVDGNYALYGSHVQRWLTLQNKLSEPIQLYEQLRAERTRCEHFAWEFFSNGQFEQFGYYAETWDSLTNIIGDNAKNPFKAATVKINAKGRSKNLKYSNVKEFSTASLQPQAEFTHISDNSWLFIRPLFLTESDRTLAGRYILDGILYGIAYCKDFKDIPEEYGTSRLLRQMFSKWYRAGVFTDLVEFVTVCPELEAVKGSLWEIEKYRLIYGNLVPRFKEIKREGI
jgi:hypothetical protein